MVDGALLALDELVLEVLQDHIINGKLALQGAIGDPAMLPQHRNRLAEDVVERHGGSSAYRVDVEGRCGHPPVRDQSCWVANAAPSVKAWSLAHMMEACTRGVKAPWEKPQSVPAMTFSRPTSRA